MSRSTKSLSPASKPSNRRLAARRSYKSRPAWRPGLGGAPAASASSGVIESALGTIRPMDAANLGDVLRAAERSKAAIIDCRDWHNPATLSYGALEQFASAIARGLLARGLERGERVAVLSANGGEFVAAYLGIMRAGLVAVPLNHKLPRPALEIVLEDCAPRLVLYEADRRTLLPPGIHGVEFA